MCKLNVQCSLLQLYVAPQRKRGRASSSFSCVRLHWWCQLLPESGEPFRGVLREANTQETGRPDRIQCCRSAPNLDRLSTSIPLVWTHAVDEMNQQVTCAPAMLSFPSADMDIFRMNHCTYANDEELSKGDFLLESSTLATATSSFPNPLLGRR